MTPIRTTIKKRFLAGLAALVPIIITITVLLWFFEFVDGLLGRLFDRILGYHVYGLGFISAILIVLIVGVISTNVVGKSMIGLVEKMFFHLPVFKGIYTGLKHLVDAFSPENTSSFKKFVIVEYPRSGVFMFGFLTKECTIKAADNGNEGKFRAVYIPTNNLYLGEVVLFRGEDVFNTDIPIEEGIKIILSGGTATPSKIIEGRE